jgi:hypothetical protein
MKGLSPNMKGLSPNMKGLSPCVEFLQWALPRLGRRWAGYRKVRRQVCRRVRRRIEDLGQTASARTASTSTRSRTSGRCSTGS